MKSFLLCLIFVFCVLPTAATKKTINPINLPKSFLPRFQANMKNSYVEGRYDNVHNVLSQAAGVYKPSARHRHPNVTALQNTVLITVVAANTPENEKYSIFLRHLLCYIQHHRLKLVVFYLHHAYPEWKRDFEHLDHVYLLTYPDYMFWQLVSTKQTEIIEGNAYAKYDSDIPTFSSYGALVMLVPVLETLEHNFNVIFLDADVVLVRDPIPYLIQSQADLSMSIESRGCQEYFSAAYPNFFDYYKIEPNSGVMYARATPSGKEMFRGWLEMIVDNNFVNDQRAFHPKELEARYDASCHQGRHAYTPPIIKNMNFTESSPTFCYYDELWVQNGMIGITCPGKKQFRDEWVLNMYKYGTYMHNLNTTSSDLLKGYDDSIFTVSSHARFPVILHSNYVNDKVKEYNLRGLWILRLYDNGSVPAVSLSPDLHPFCLPYQLNRTMYAGINWIQEVSEIHQRQAELFATYIKPHALVKALASPSIHYIGENLTRHVIPDGETFDSMFPDSWNKIEVIPYVMLLNLTEGDAIKSVRSDKKHDSTLVHHPIITKQDISRHVQKHTDVQSRYPAFVEKAKSSRDVSRAAHVKHVLSLASGIHRQSSVNMSSSAHGRSVLLTVISAEEAGYDRLLDNLICAVERLDYKLVVYIVNHDSSNHTSIILHRQYKLWEARGVYLLAYPNALFWHLLAMKKNEILASSSRVSRVKFDSTHIRFSAYGQLVKLIPILEVLHNLHSAVYLDIDVVPLSNFVDFLRNSVADITMARNIAKCSDTTSLHRRDIVAGHNVQLDSSILFVRIRGYHSFKRYIESVIHDNVYRDTDSFLPDKLMLAHDVSCHASSVLRGISANLDSDAANSRPAHTNKGTYCLLETILFQNYYVAIKCPNNRDYRDDFVLQMVKQGIQAQTAKQHTIFLPYTVHFSSVEVKASEMISSGFWMAQGRVADATLTCKNLNLDSTVYVKTDWIGQYQRIVAKREIQLASIRKNGTLVRAVTGAQIYYVDDQSVRHAIPDGNTFIQKFGESSWSRVVSVPLGVLLSLPQGEMLTRVEVAP